MSQFQSIFKRYEKKYILTSRQKQKILETAKPYLAKDKYFHSTICSIYYDTPSRLMIRNSIEKPIYKEKLRLRSYGTPSADDKVFIELKKKYRGVVYKRRTAMALREAEMFLSGKLLPKTQIEKELAWALKYYEGIEPAMFVSYERDSYCGIQDSTLRITFDSNPLIREEKLSLADGIWGEKILQDGLYIMEVKTPYAMPLWLADELDRLKIFPASFSKYGTGYINSLKKQNTSGLKKVQKIKKLA